MPKTEITITINGDDSTSASSSKKKHRRGPHIGKRDDEILSRRKTSGFVNFWDLGQISNGMGGFTDIAFRVIPTPAFGGLQHLDFSATDWDSFWTYIFGVSIGNWETSYKKLSFAEAERYGLSLFDQDSGLRYQVSRNGANLGNDTSNPVSDTKWTEKGLKLPAGVSHVFFESGGNGAFALWSTDPTFFKITTGNTFGSAEVPFTFKGNTKVFLLPRISSVSMTSDFGGDSDAVIYPYKCLQRSFFLSRNYDVNPYPLFSAGSGLDLSAADKISLKNHIAADPGSVYWTSGGGYGGSPTSFPAYANHREMDINVLGSTIIPPAPYYTGKLVAVIKQGSVTYYVWSKNTGVVFSNERTINL